MKPRTTPISNLVMALAIALVASGRSLAIPMPFTISGQGINATGTFTTSPINLGPYGIVPGYGPAWKVDGVTGTFSDSTLGITGTFAGVMPASMDYTSIPRPSDYPSAGDPGNHGTIGKNPGPYDISYDNIIYPGSNSPNVCPNYYSYGGGPLDLFGLLLQVNKTGGGTVLVNLWSNGDLDNPANVLGVDYGIAIGDYVPGDAKPFQQLRYIGDGNAYQNDPTSYSGSGISFVVTVPEIDPAGMGTVLALVTGGLGLLERRRRKTA